MGAVISSSFKKLVSLLKRKSDAPIVENPVANQLDVDDFSDDGKSLYLINCREELYVYMFEFSPLYRFGSHGSKYAAGRISIYSN